MFHVTCMDFRHFPYMLHTCNTNAKMHVCVNNMQTITCTDVKTGIQVTCMVYDVTIVTVYLMVTTSLLGNTYSMGHHLTTWEHLQYVEYSYIHTKAMVYQTISHYYIFSICLYNITIRCHFSLWDSHACTMQ